MKKLPEKGIAFLSKDPSVQRAASGQTMGTFQQHVFERRPQGLRILEINLKPPLKLAPGQHISPRGRDSPILLWASCSPMARAVH